MAFFKQTVTDFLDEIIGSATISDEKREALNTLAVKEMALYTAVSFVADLIAGCSIQVYEKDKPAKNGNWYLWNVSPNPNQSAYELIFEWVFNYYTRGKGLIVPVSKSLYVAEDGFSINRNFSKGDTFSSVTIQETGLNKTFSAKQVYYIDQAPKEIKRLFDSIFEGYKQLLIDESNTSGQNSGEKYVLNLETYPSGTQEQKQAYMDTIQANLKTFVDADSSAYIATKGQSLQRLSMSSTSASSNYISIRKEVYAIAAAALHIPYGLLEGNTTASDQLLSQALTTAVAPLAKKISTELTRKTYTMEQVTYDGCRMVVDTSAVKHIDMMDAADKIDKLISCGYVCIDELRKRIGLPELNTEWSQKHYLTKNYSDIAEADPLEEEQHETEKVLPAGNE